MQSMTLMHDRYNYYIMLEAVYSAAIKERGVFPLETINILKNVSGTYKNIVRKALVQIEELVDETRASVYATKYSTTEVQLYSLAEQIQKCFHEILTIQHSLNYLADQSVQTQTRGKDIRKAIQQQQEIRDLIDQKDRTLIKLHDHIEALQRAINESAASVSSPVKIKSNI